MEAIDRPVHYVAPIVYIVHCAGCSKEMNSRKAFWTHCEPRCLDCQKEFKKRLKEKHRVRSMEGMEQTTPEDDFMLLVDILRGSGYDVEVTQETTPGEYLFAKVTGEDIFAGFCTKNDGLSYPDLDGKIAADHVDCYDKWSKCPLILPLPEGDDQTRFLLEQLEYWGSVEGYEKSNEYQTDTWVKAYPEE